MRTVRFFQSSPTVFSAGLDILEMYKPDAERVRAFWTTLQDVWLKLYGSAFPTAAAINVRFHNACINSAVELFSFFLI